MAEVSCTILDRSRRKICTLQGTQAENAANGLNSDGGDTTGRPGGAVDGLN
jgi:hypothetical protein